MKRILAVLAVALGALMLTACSDKPPAWEDNMKAIDVNFAQMGIYGALLEDNYPEAVQQTRLFVLAAADAGWTDEQLIEETNSLIESGCDECADVVWEAIND